MNLHGVLNRGHGRRLLAGGAVMALGLALGGAASVANASSSSDKDHKVWVCKYVGTPYENEVLKDGKQPISVDSHSTDGTGVGGYFNDAHGQSSVLALVTKANTDKHNHYNGQLQCPPPREPKLAKLTLEKEVVNIGGGTAKATDWTLAAAGPTSFSGKTPASKEVKEGAYTLSESGPSGYHASDWDCGKAKMSGDNTVAVKDKDVTCTITNTFVHKDGHKAQLTLEKEVVNTGGGTAKATDWTLAAAGPTSFSGMTPATKEVKDGTYTLSESGPAGYDASGWDCGKAKMSDDNTVAVKEKDVTCTITNTFVPPIIPGTPDVPAISLDKIATLNDVTTAGNTAGKADPGETISYSFLVHNTGNVTLTDVKVADTKLGAAAVTCDPTTLLAGAEVTCTAAAYKVTPADVAAGAPIDNVATASGLPPTGDRVSATDSASVPTTKPTPAVAPVVTPPVVSPAEVAGVVEQAPVVTPAPTTLAFTGAETVPLGLSGVFALVLGAFLMVTSRRQRPKRQAAHRARL